MRTFVIGDIHAGHLALKQCLERSGFDYDQDELICLGDICDGWPDLRETIDELLKIKHLQLIIGNHDLWFIEWYHGNHPGDIWTTQGGLNSQRSYGDSRHNVPDEHRAFFMRGNYWMLDERNRLFVHGGINPELPLENHAMDILLWDRRLVAQARKDHEAKVPKATMTQFDEVYVGHTSTNYFTKDRTSLPMNFYEIWMLDTGGGWEGKLTIMDIDTKEYWQSDLLTTLYHPDTGRGSHRKKELK